MPVLLRHHSNEHYLEVTLQGKLEKRDYEELVPRIEALIAQHGRLRLLVVLHDFHGWTLTALWEDIKFDVRHAADVERLAVVGETRWQESMTSFCKPFTSAAVRYFHHFEIDEARNWLRKEPHASAPEPVETTGSAV